MKRFVKTLLAVSAAPAFLWTLAQSEDAVPPTEDVAAAAETTVQSVDEGSTETAAAETPAEVSAPTGGSYKIVKGDTLWSLSGQYLKDPYQWTKIWEANKGVITNPDLIYPDQEVLIPSLDAAAQMAEAPSAPAEAPASEPMAAPAEEAATTEVAPVPVAADETGVSESVPAVEPEIAAAETIPLVEEEDAPVAPKPVKRRSTKTGSADFMGGLADSFIAGDDWEYDGYIIRDRDQKLMISQGDVIFLNVGTASGVLPKMTGGIYRLGNKVKDPFLKRVAGKLLKRVGTFMVTGAVNDEGCTAVVLQSVEPIRVGDLVRFNSGN